MLAILLTAVLSTDWPQWMGLNRDGVWSETGIVEKFNKNMKPLWRAPIHNGYAGPAVSQGKVFVMDYVVAAGDLTPDAGRRSKLTGKERILCLDAKTGKELWKHEYEREYNVSFPSGPRATPTVMDGKVYCLGTMGDLTCLSVEGQVLFSKNLSTEYQVEAPFWGHAASPLVVGNSLYCMVGGKGSTVVALDKNTGKELWKALDSESAGYCPPSLIEAGGVRQLVIWHPEAVVGLNPENGQEYWNVPLKPAYGMSITAPQKLGDLLYAAGEGQQGVAIELDAKAPKAKVLWRGKSNTGVYPICGTPILHEGMIFGVCENGELRGVDLKTGKRHWTDTKPITGGKRLGSGSAFIVRNNDRFFLFAETGDLIIARMNASKYEEIDRMPLLEPTGEAWGRSVLWSHPAFADRCVFARNDKEIVCYSLAN
jgi:outer membrane protein assembly factor BamB